MKKRPTTISWSGECGEPDERGELLGLLFLGLQTGIAAGRKLGLKFLDSSSRIDVAQLARVKRVADVADIDLQFLPRAPRLERITTAAANRGFVIGRVDALLHGSPPG
jgi:hypothetical protein